MVNVWRYLGERKTGWAVGILLATGLGLILLLSQLGFRFTHLSYDLPFLLQRVEVPREAAIVYIDDESYDRLHQSYFAPWDRSLHARLLDRLRQDNARAVVFDVVFSGPGPEPKADERFEQALQASGKAVLAADDVVPFYGQFQKASQILPPHEPFMNAAANVGTARVNPDHDLTVRELSAPNPDELLPPLCWAAAEVASPGLTERLQQRPRQRYVRYYGPPGTIPNVSYHRALDTNDLAPGFFRDKTVFVGSRLFSKTAGERKDEYGSPFTHFAIERRRFMPGVEIQATFFLNLIRGDSLARLKPRTELLLIVLTGILAGGGLALGRPLPAGLSALALALGAGATAVLLQISARPTFFSWLIIEAQIAAGLLWSVFYNSVVLFIQKRLMQQSLAMYVSPGQVQQIIKRPDILRPGAAKQEVSILFSDIADFTSVSEGMDSDDLARLMNRYFETAVTQCIHRTEGTVVKFIGDAIFAIWNAPERQTDHAERCCRAALLLRDSAGRFDAGERLPALRTRIGLHTGLANVGNFGSSTRIDYTAIGENINLASRMEGLNKFLGTDVLITGAVEAAVRGRFATRFLGRFRLKGFEKAVEVFELLAETCGDPIPEWREAFDNALKRFLEGDHGAARAGFETVLRLHPEDGPARFYMHYLEEHPSRGTAHEPAGEVILKEK